MKIAAFQMDVIRGDKERNYEKALKGIAEASQSGADVVVLPEMWNVGFLTVSLGDDEADADGERTKTFLSESAQKYNINIVGGSVATKRGEKYYNTSYIYSRDGELVGEYDKAHLFSLGKEEDKYQAGNRVVTFKLDGVPCGIMICYDLRFPEWARLQALAGAKLLFVPAQWPETRVSHWRILNQARAIENQFFVIGVNGCGWASDSEKNAGNSMIINPIGELVADAGTKTDEKMIIAQIDITEVDSVRKRVTVFADRREELYGHTV